MIPPSDLPSSSLSSSLRRVPQPVRTYTMVSPRARALSIPCFYPVFSLSRSQQIRLILARARWMVYILYPFCHILCIRNSSPAFVYQGSQQSRLNHHLSQRQNRTNNPVRIHYGFMKNRADFLPLILRMMEYSSGQETGLKSPLRAKNGKTGDFRLRFPPADPHFQFLRIRLIVSAVSCRLSRSQKCRITSAPSMSLRSIGSPLW